MVLVFVLVVVTFFITIYIPTQNIGMNIYCYEKCYDY